MLNTQDFGRRLAELGFTFYSGVPCSFLKSLINYAICEANYVAAANEGDAVAHCFGASLAGTKSVVLMQNSGLTNATSPLTSLNYPFKVPVLGLVSLRGEPGLGDEPQHELMGRITTELLSVMDIDWAYLCPDAGEMEAQLQQANAAIEAGRSFFFVVKKNTFESYPLKDQRPRRVENRSCLTRQGPDERPPRARVLEQLSAARRDSTVLLATTGVSGRELYQIKDAPNNLYMVGSMGCIAPIGLGLALERPDLKVVCIDGDGALLMRLGALSTLAQYGPPNLLHLLLDNNVHESTGGQLTASHNVDFAAVAAACGYRHSLHAHSLSELMDRFTTWQERPELTFLDLSIAPGHLDPLVRPKEKPAFIARRLMNHIHP